VQNKTKIIATIGPKSESYETLKALAEAGMDIVRRNFSHCTKEEYRAMKENLERIGKELGRHIPIMQDLQGPRIRIGRLPKEGIDLKEGEEYIFAYGTEMNSHVIPLDDTELHEDMNPGDSLFLTNGAIQLEVKSVEKGEIRAVVERGGRLFSNKAVNVPDTILRKGGLTEKDIEHVLFALEEGIDYIALSFVQTKEDIEKLRNIIGERGTNLVRNESLANKKSEEGVVSNGVKIVAKIERAVALENIDEIIDASDGIMVARGDLGIEIPFEEVPIVQKELIQKARAKGKQAIVATQMMISMMTNPLPTRAEVSDIANAVLDGADTVMLSDETAMGEYPVEAVKIMRKIVERAEKHAKKQQY